MPLPYPGEKENKKEFMDRCLGDDNMKREFRDIAQRYAVCSTRWETTGKAAQEGGKLHT